MKTLLILERAMLELDEFDEAMADRLRDLMDPLWYALTDAEREELNSRDGVKHHAIVVTGILQYHDSPTLIGLEKAHARASEIFRWVSPISAVDLNGHLSFFVPPDGAEGLGSDLGDERRKTFTDWLRENSKCQWVEVAYV